jgi:hypothetical protein
MRTLIRGHVTRRSFLGVARIAAAALVVGFAAAPRSALAAALTKAQRDQMTPDDSIRRR